MVNDYMKKFFLFLLTILLLVGNVIPIFAEESTTTDFPEFPTLESQYIVLMDADSGEVLFERNGNSRCYPASTTKLLTALLTVENAILSDKITYTKNAVDSVTYGDANASISEGEILSVEQSLYCLLLRSANDVAYGIGEYIGGNINDFCKIMNDRAFSLGAGSTHFSNASGLTDENHYSTPYDMALIGRACFNNKTIMNILNYDGVYTIGKTNKSNFIRYYTHRYQMIKGGDYEYPYSLGGKTGYTDAAGSCLVSFAEKDGLRLVCSVMRSSDTARYTDTIALFDYYFNNFKKLSIKNFSTSIETSGIDILNLLSDISGSSGTTIGFEEDAYILVPNYVKQNDLNTNVIYSDDTSYNGKSGGFACLNYTYNNEIVGKTTIYITSKNIDSLPGTNGIEAYYSDIKLQNENIFYINIFLLLGIIILILGIIVFLIIKTKTRHHFTHYHSKKLHF